MSGSRASVAPRTDPSSGVRLAGVEGLRALAATSIVVVHVWGFSTPGGALGGPTISDALSTFAVGVTLFFTLSGFLLYRPFVASIACGVAHTPIRAYLRNRVLRIVPAYWVILTVVALTAAANVRVGNHIGVGRLSDPAGLTSAALLLQDYRPSTVVIGIGPAWSLAVEVVFYCVLPVLVVVAAWAARRAQDRRGRIVVLLGPPLLLLLIGLSGKYAANHAWPGAPTAGYGQNWHSVVERSFWAQADLFAFGMAIAVLYTEMRDGRVHLPRHWRRAAIVLALLVFIPSAWTMHQGEQSYTLQNTGEALGIALLFATVILPTPETTQLRAVRLLETRPLLAAGVVSYSVFLWHHPVINWLEGHGLTLGGWGGLLVNLVVVLGIVGILSALTYRFVELPALRLKRSTRQQSKSSSARAEPKSAAVPATETAADPHAGSVDARAPSLP